jgi:hypothetical protein
MPMRTLLLFPLLGLLFLHGCIPLYMAGARAAVSTVAGVASGGRAAGTPAAAELPQDEAALRELYTGCLRQRATTPGLDCGQYRNAVVRAKAQPEQEAVKSEAGKP